MLEGALQKWGGGINGGINGGIFRIVSLNLFFFNSLVVFSVPIIGTYHFYFIDLIDIKFIRSEIAWPLLWFINDSSCSSRALTIILAVT